MKMRILIAAYYCSPYRGGEAAVGWQVASRLAMAGHEVHVLCGDLSGDEPTRKDLERYTSEQGLPEGLTIHHVAADATARRLHDWHCKPGMWFLYYPAYRHWQKLALQKAVELHAESPFDIAHQLTIIGYREPGDLWQTGIPFVWGPINGAAVMPWRFISGLGGGGAYRHLTRNLMNALQMRLPGRSRRAARAAAKIWAVTKEDQMMVEKIWKCRAELMIETGATPCESARVKSKPSGEALRLVWCGIIEARKALHLVLQALARLPSTVTWELQVIGDGPQRDLCEALSKSLQIDARVRWTGNVEHSEAQRLMEYGHALVHSALKEGTPHVVLESMARGLPVICHDACGMGVAVDQSSGIRIPMLDPHASIAGFQNAILRLATEPGLLESLSAGAMARARELSWDAKIEKFTDAYRQVIENKAKRATGS
jgi:glycosyltransferase involved in cell wall biosynthesis